LFQQRNSGSANVPGMPVSLVFPRSWIPCRIFPVSGDCSISDSRRLRQNANRVCSSSSTRCVSVHYRQVLLPVAVAAAESVYASTVTVYLLCNRTHRTTTQWNCAWSYYFFI